MSDLLEISKNKLDNILKNEKTADLSLSDLGTKLKSFVNNYKWPIAGAGALGLGAAGLYAINKSVENLPAKPDVGYDIMFFDDPTFPTAWKHKVTFNPDGSVRSDELIPKQASLLEGNTATEKSAGDTSMPTNFSQEKLAGASANAEKTADFKTRFGQDLGGFFNHMAYGGVGGALLGGLYNDMTGGSPDDFYSDMVNGMHIGALLTGLYGGVKTHIGMNGRIHGLNDLLARRFTSGVSPNYQARTENIKSEINKLTNGGFIAGFNEVF